jgi:hypothetical protein
VELAFSCAPTSMSLPIQPTREGFQPEIHGGSRHMATHFEVDYSMIPNGRQVDRIENCHPFLERRSP